MKKEIDILFRGEKKITSLTVNSTGYWQFNFDDYFISMDTFNMWRLLRNGKLICVSSDHGELFGLESPLDIRKQTEQIIKKINLIQIKRDVNTGDLFFIFENAVVIEFFTTSMGYENWSLYINGKQYISMGGGELA